MTRLRILPALMAGLVLATSAQAAPTQLSADAGEFHDIKYASGNGATAVVYAASQGGGVFKSTNGGVSWAVTGLNTGYVNKIAVSPVVTVPPRVYAATEAGIFRTTNAGTSWTQLTFTPARSVAVLNNGGADLVLAGVPGQGVLRSTDQGATWTRQSADLPSTDISQIVFQPTTNHAYVVLDCNYQDITGSFGDGQWGGIWRTTNAAATPITWTNFSNGGGGGTTLGNQPNCVKALAANSTFVYAGTYNPFGAEGRIYRTSGGGWAAPAPGNPNAGDLFGVESVSIDRTDSNRVHGGGRSIGVWSSPTGNPALVDYVRKVDPTLTEAPRAHTKIYAIESIVGDANVLLIAAKGAGIQRTANFSSVPASNITWVAATGLKADRVRALANHASAAPNTYWMALEQGGVFSSANAGGTWTHRLAGMDFGGTLGSFDMFLSATAIGADPNNTAIVIAGTRGGGLISWNGAQWTTTGIPTPLQVGGGVDFKPQTIVYPAPGLVYYSLFDGPGVKGGGLHRSSTGPSGLAPTVYPGDAITCATPVVAGPSGYKVTQTPGGRTYYLRYDGLPYRSTDNFLSNTATCITAPEVGFERLFFHDIQEHPGAPNLVVGSSNKGIYRSNDGGVNWTRLTVTAPAGFSTVLAGLAYLNNGNIYGITRAGGLFCSPDQGNTWHAVSLGGLPPVPFRDIKVLNGAIHILTDGGGVYNGFASTCP